MFSNYGQLINNKWRGRLSTLFLNSIRNIVPLFINSLVSFLVIRLTSFSTWGSFVLYLIYFNLGAQVISWGSKQYLLREFASQPSQIGTVWFNNLKSRLLLLLLINVVILIMKIPAPIKALLILWQFSAYAGRSYEALIIYYKKIKLFLASEIILSLLLFILIFTLRNNINVNTLIISFASVEIMRMIFSVIYFNNLLRFNFSFKIELKYLTAGFAFFVLAALGMIQSRLDLFFVASLLPPADTAVYQVLLNIILLSQAASGFIIQPYLKTFYRMNQAGLTKLSNRFIWFGLTLSIPAVLIIRLFLRSVYGITLDFEMSFLTYCYIAPIYYYTIKIYLLYKKERETAIIFAGITVLLLSLPVNYYLIPLFGLKGALLAGVTGEILSLFLYHLIEKRGAIFAGTFELGKAAN